jgi:pullulanase/glycogen debranching enzyme
MAADSAASIYVAYNGWYQPINVNLPPARQGKGWHLVTDTSSLAVVPQNMAPVGQEVPVPNAAYVIQGRSLLLLFEN